MKDFKFEPEDFEARFHCFPIEEFSSVCRTAADIANAILNKHLEAAPVVWFNYDETMSPYWECSSRQDKTHTHTARLVDIREIKPKVCSHTPIRDFDYDDIWRCYDCGIKLKATWQPA